MRNFSFNIYSLGILCALIASLFLLDHRGKAARTSGYASRMDDPRVARRQVANPRDVYREWRGAGQRGRIVVSLSARAHFVPAEDETDIITRKVFPSFPLQVFNLADVMEEGLNDQNFLYLAMKTGIAREVIHVLPQSVFSENIRKWESSGGRVKNGMVSIPFFGAPRSVTTLSSFTAPEEPLLVFVNASFFRENEPDAVWRDLQKAGVKTDLIVFCSSTGDKEETAREKERLAAFARMLGPADGKN